MATIIAGIGQQKSFQKVIDCALDEMGKTDVRAPEQIALYQALARATVELAVTKGSLSRTQADELTRDLEADA